MRLFVAISFRQRKIFRQRKTALRRFHRQRDLGSDLGRNALRGRQQLILRHTGGSDIHAIKIRPVKTPRGIEHQPRIGLPEMAQHMAHTTGKADLHLRHGHETVFGHHDNVANQSQHAARANGGTIHCGDHRLAAFHDAIKARAHQAIMAREGALPRYIRPILQIRTGREIPSLTGQHNRAHLRHFVEGVEDVRDLLAKGTVLRIHRRTRDHHRCDVIVDVDLEGLQIGKRVHRLLQHLHVSMTRRRESNAKRRKKRPRTKTPFHHMFQGFSFGSCFSMLYKPNGLNWRLGDCDQKKGLLQSNQYANRPRT